MAERNSEYRRMDGDTYVTPQWVWDSLYSVEPQFKEAFDCAPINANFDFLKGDWFCPPAIIATNPPYSKAKEFCDMALSYADSVAMLLPMAFDTAKTRRYLFENRRFKAKYVITKRIRWENLEQKKNGPSQNHAWFIWDGNNEKAFIGYLP